MSLLLLVAKTGFNLSLLRKSILFTRWRTWSGIALIYALAVLAGPLPLLLLVLFLVFQGQREYSALVKLPIEYALFMYTISFLTLLSTLVSLNVFYLLMPLFLILGTLAPLVFPHEKNGLRHLAFAIFGWSYIAWLLSHLLLISKYTEQGRAVLLVAGLATAMSDVGAYILGKSFGHHKLSPILSPNKTVEGTLGNLLGAYIGTGLMFLVLPVDLGLPLLILLPPGIAVGSVWGDLVESAIKREFGVKDAGNWLPGFGGLLDRIDSLILVAPFVFYFLWYISPVLPGDS